MKPVSCKRHQFPLEVIRHAVWLYFRFALSLRDVEELLARRGVEAVYNVFNLQPNLMRRPTLRHLRATAYQTWAAATVAA